MATPRARALLNAAATAVNRAGRVSQTPNQAERSSTIEQLTSSRDARSTDGRCKLLGRRDAIKPDWKDGALATGRIHRACTEPWESPKPAEVKAGSSSSDRPEHHLQLQLRGPPSGMNDGSIRILSMGDTISAIGAGAWTYSQPVETRLGQAPESLAQRFRRPQPVQATTNLPAAAAWRVAMYRAFHPINSVKVMTVRTVDRPTMTSTGSR